MQLPEAPERHGPIPPLRLEQLHGEAVPRHQPGLDLQLEERARRGEGETGTREQTCQKKRKEEGKRTKRKEERERNDLI